MRIAVVSDLHVGPNARARELCVPLSQTSTAVEENFLDRFRRLAVDEHLDCDYLILPGDISHSSAADELEVASDVVLSIAEALGVSEDAIVVCPGNHDKDWRPLANDGKGASRHGPECYEAIRCEHRVFGRSLSTGRPSLVEAPFFSVREFPDLVIASYNSGWDDGPKSEPSHGLVHPDHIAELREELSSVQDDGRFRLLLVHHHPLLYADPIPVPDHSAMVNAENLLELAGERGFDLVIHGHKHFPRFRNYLTSANHLLAILCAGSFAARIDQEWRDIVNNQFHVVSLDGRSPDSSFAFGTIRSWTYRVFRGWEPSDYPSAGIEHMNRFGSAADPDMLARDLLELVRRRLEEVGYVTLSQLRREDPDVDHLPARAAERLMRRLAQFVPCELHPSDDPVLLPRSRP